MRVCACVCTCHKGCDAIPARQYRVCACTCACVFVRVYVCMRVQGRVRVCVRVWARVCATRGVMQLSSVGTNPEFVEYVEFEQLATGITTEHAHICIYIYVCIHVFMYIYVYICIYIYVYIYIYICIFPLYIYKGNMYIHTSAYVYNI